MVLPPAACAVLPASYHISTFLPSTISLSTDKHTLDLPGHQPPHQLRARYLDTILGKLLVISSLTPITVIRLRPTIVFYRSSIKHQSPPVLVQNYERLETTASITDALHVPWCHQRNGNTEQEKLCIKW